MSDQTTGELAVAQPPPTHQNAASNAVQEQSNPSFTNDASLADPLVAPLPQSSQHFAQTNQASASDSHTDQADTTSSIPVSTSERNGEAMTAVQERSEQHQDANGTSRDPESGNTSSPSAQVSAAAARKFTSLNVNKRFLEKAGPTPPAASPAALKLGASVSPRPANRLSSPSASTRLMSAKLSSVPKPQPAGWATTKPATPVAKTTTSSQTPTAITPALTPTPTPTSTPATATATATATNTESLSDTLPTTTVTSSDPLPAEASAPTPKAISSPKPANASATPQVASSTAGAAASPRLVSMARDSPRPGSTGLESASGQGRASPGLRNAALGSSLRAVSPANNVSRAPWAGVKSSLSPNITPANSRGNRLSDFPTAAEAARSKQEQEVKAAAAAAREAARQQAALQALDRFRGTSLGSGKHWDEMEDEDCGFFGEVVEFGDGSQYKIPTSNDRARNNGDDAPPLSKEDRFKDVSHDRSWPQCNASRPGNATQNERPRPAAAQSAAWGPLKNREAAVSATTESAQPTSRPSRSEQRAEKVIIPTTGASVSLRSPTESRELISFSYGRDRRSGPGPAPYSGGRQDHSGPPQPAQAATTQAVRAWGPLAQRQASLNPGAALPASSAPAKPAQPVETAARSASIATSAAPEPASPSLPPAQPQEQPQQPRQQSRERPSVPATGLPNTNGRPLPPHLLVAGSGDAHPPAQTSRPLPPHFVQNLRPAVPAAPANTIGRKTSHAIDEARHPNVPTSHVPHNDQKISGSHLQHAQAAPAARQDRVGRAPWGPKAMAQARAPAPADVPTTQSSAPSAQPVSTETEEDVHAAIERARKRREEEERQRLAEKERARQKALAIEERIRAAQQQKEAEAQRAAQRQASQAAEAANATQASVETLAARKPGPADSAASWRTSRPQHVQAKSEEAKLHHQQASAQPLDQAAAAVNAVPAEQNRNGRVVSSQRDQRIADERLPSRRNQREQRTSQLGDEGRQRGSKYQDKVGRPRIPYLEVPARTEDVTARIGQVEVPKTILARPARSSSTTSPVEARPRVSPAVAPIDSRPQKSASLSAQRAATKTDTSPRPRESAPQDRPLHMSVPAASPVATSAPVSAPVPVRLYPLVAKEAIETRQEVVQDAPPAWNRYVVQIKESLSRLKLNRYQQKQLFARMAAMKAPGRAVYPLTWDPPLAYLSIKTLSRDDQLFPKRFHRGAVITPVKLPSRVLPRGLAPVVPNLASQGVSAGSRKQARFDLTSHWSDGHNTIGGLGNGTASDAQPAGMSPSGQIQVRLPGHHATVVQPSAGGHFPDNVQAALMTANRRSQPVDPTTDAIIGEVLSAGASQTTFEDRSRAFPAGAAPGSLGPLDHPQNGYPTDTFGSHNSAGGYRSKGRRSSNAAVAFYDDRQVSTPSPVSFMVNSEIKADTGGARGSLSPFGMPGSTRALQAQTPASGGSMLPSPSLSTQGTWGQSSLTFPVLETRSSNLPDRDHIKNVWSLAANSHSGELQNSLKGIQDDFLPSTMPMSVHDFRADEGRLSGAQQDDGSGWGSSSFNRFQQYNRAQHDMNSSSRELSPVTNRSNGFDPTSRSPSLGMDASAAAAAAAARAREAGHHHQSVSQQASNAYSSINGGAYGSTTASSYSPRERQQDAGSGFSQGAFGAYGGYTSSASNNMSMTTDALYGVSNYGGGSMTPNRQTYSQYGAHSSAAAARSAPGSPYSGLSGRHSSTLTSGASCYSLFPTSGGSGGASGGSGGARTSQAGNGMEGLGVLDDTTFGSAAGRNQFYGARGYQQPSSTQQGQTQGSQQQHSTQKWPSSPASSGSVLRPAASVFNPQKYTQQRTSASQSQSQSQSQVQSQQARLAAHHHQQHHAHHGQLESSNGSGGPIDRETNASAAGNNGGGYGSGASGYAGFGSSSSLW